MMDYIKLMSEINKKRRLNEVNSLPFAYNNKIYWFNYTTNYIEDKNIVKILIDNIYAFDGILTSKTDCSEVFDFEIQDDYIGDDDEYYDYLEKEMSKLFEPQEINCEEMWNKIDSVSPTNFIKIYKEVQKLIQ